DQGDVQIGTGGAGGDVVFQPLNVAQWKVLKTNGDLMAVRALGQHIRTFGAGSDLSGTLATSASTTASFTFATAYTATPACVLTPQTTGLTSWYLSAISTTGFTVTVAPSGTYTFGFH